jgi:hypothetical protein
MFRTILLSTAILVLSATVTHAGVIAYESFEDYAAEGASSTNYFGVVTTGDGGYNWAGDWVVDPLAGDSATSTTGATRGLFPIAGGYSYNAGAGATAISIDGGDNRLQYRPDTGVPDPAALMTRQFAAQNGTIYLGFLFEATSTPGFMQFGLSSTGDVGKPDSPDFAGSLILRDMDVRSGDTSTDEADGGSYSNDTLYMLVLKIEKDASSNYNKATIFVNPTSTNEGDNTSASVTADSGLDEVSYVKLRLDLGSVRDFLNFDEIRVADTFAGAVGAEPVPEPATLGFLALGGIMGLTSLARRRCR